jgi:hypothetical protein
MATEMQKLEYQVFVVFGLLVAGLIGCGGSEKVKNRKPVYPVSGQFLLDGAPAGGAMVSFHPLNAKEPGRPLPSQALADEAGKFTLTTYVTADGAPEGDYVVTIYWPAARGEASHGDEDDGDGELPPDRLRGRFASPASSKLRAHVNAKATSFAPLDLNATDRAQGGEISFREQQ